MQSSRMELVSPLSGSLAIPLCLSANSELTTPLPPFIIHTSRSYTGDRKKTFDDMISDASMDAYAAYATVFGPWKNTLAAVDPATPNAMPVSTGLCARAQNRGMVVTPYTFRPEVNQASVKGKRRVCVGGGGVAGR